jgi:hypothetical protein
VLFNECLHALKSRSRRCLGPQPGWLAQHLGRLHNRAASHLDAVPNSRKPLRGNVFFATARPGGLSHHGDVFQVRHPSIVLVNLAAKNCGGARVLCRRLRAPGKKRGLVQLAAKSCGGALGAFTAGKKRGFYRLRWRGAPSAPRLNGPFLLPWHPARRVAPGSPHHSIRPCTAPRADARPRSRA